MKLPLLFLSLLFFATGGEKLLADDGHPPKVINVRHQGASGDGMTDDTRAFQAALDAVAAAGGGEVEVPAGIYKTGSLVLKSHTTLRLDSGATIMGSGDLNKYPVTSARWEGLELPCHQALIHADHADGVTITGSGMIEGAAIAGAARNPRGPAIIEPIDCSQVKIEGITVKGARIWTIHPTFCRDVVISRVTIDTTGWNSDGIDPDSCQGVLIDRCTLTSGDDDIAIKSGKGREGVRLGRPSSDITITNCLFLKGNCGIAFGSELSGGIRQVVIRHCVFKNGNAALYLKSRAGRAGYIEDVSAHDLEVGPEPLLQIDTAYGTNPDAQGVPGVNGLTHFARIDIGDVRVNCARTVTVIGVPENPVVDLSLANITGTSTQPWVFTNCRRLTLKNIHLVGNEGPVLELDHASGTGLDQANR